MKKVLLVAAMVSLTSPVGWAETCAIGTLATHASKTSSCIPDRASFSDFSYSQALSAARTSQVSDRPDKSGVPELADGAEEFSPVDVPEPTSMLLLGSGLLGLAGLIRFHHRSKR